MQSLFLLSLVWIARDSRVWAPLPLLRSSNDDDGRVSERGCVCFGVRKGVRGASVRPCPVCDTGQFHPEPWTSGFVCSWNVGGRVCAHSCQYPQSCSAHEL